MKTFMTITLPLCWPACGLAFIESIADPRNPIILCYAVPPTEIFATCALRSIQPPHWRWC
jgi:ABC-type Fe3+ transport system permease subunit